MIKKLLFFILTLTLPIKLSTVLADEITSFEFMDKSNTSFIIGANSYVNGNFSVVVEDTTQTKPYINLLIATTGYPDFVITENNYFANTVIKKLYSSGTTNINGYTADLYVVQFSTRGTNWNCSTSGLNCYVNTQLRLNNTYPYNSMYQLQSISLTDTVLTDDYLANMQINQNNEIIEQGRETNDKLDNLNDTIKDEFNTCRDSQNLFDFNTFKSENSSYITGTADSFSMTGTDITLYYIYGVENTQYTISGEWSSTKRDGNLLIHYTDGTTDVIFAYYDGISQTPTDFKFTTSSGKTVDYLRFRTFSGNFTFSNLMINEGTTALSYEPYGEQICFNKIDETNDKLDNLNDNITNDNVTGIQDSFSQFEDFLDENSTITQLITLPVTLYSSILQGISNSCSPFNLGTLYGESLILPCINIGNYLGSTLWGMIDLIISGFAIYSISKKLIKVFNNFSSMKEGDVIDD